MPQYQVPNDHKSLQPTKVATSNPVAAAITGAAVAAAVATTGAATTAAAAVKYQKIPIPAPTVVAVPAPTISLLLNSLSRCSAF